MYIKSAVYNSTRHVGRNHCTATSCFTEVIKVLLIEVSAALMDRLITSSIYGEKKKKTLCMEIKLLEVWLS